MALILGMPTALAMEPISDSDAVILARMIEGEGAHLMGSSREIAGMALVHTLLNGLEEGQSIEDGIERFHGYRYTIVPGKENVVLASVSAAIYPVMDVTNGSKFVLSLHDLDNSGARHKAIEARLSFRNGPWGLYFFRDWPGL